MKKILGYVIRDSKVTKEQAEILTHIHVAFGLLTMEGEIITDHHPFLEQMEQVRKWNPKIQIVLSVVPQEPDAFTAVSASERLRENLLNSCARLYTVNH